LDEKFPAILSGNPHNIIDFCANNVQLIVQDLEKFLGNLQRAQHIRNDQQSSWQKVKERVKNFIDNGKVILHRNHINNLIQAAKYIEPSLQIALSTILLVQSKFQ
jgi:hypothetical protein